MNQHNRYVRPGSVVLVAGAFGSGPLMTGVVDAVEDDIKNGEPGIDYTIKGTTQTHWAYLSQIRKVLTY
jgi:hypothetical protein